MKKCARCGSTENGFTKDKRATDGLNSWCKLCTRAASRKWAHENPEKQLRRIRIWSKKNRDKVNALARKWASKNREKARQVSLKSKELHPEVTAKWRAANPEKVRVYEKSYRKKNPHFARIKRNVRRARIKQASGTHTAQDIADLFESQNGLCVGCRCDISSNYHVDHVVPLARRGSNGPENLQLLCPPCNMKKGTKSQSEFLTLIRKVA